MTPRLTPGRYSNSTNCCPRSLPTNPAFWSFCSGRASVPQSIVCLPAPAICRRRTLEDEVYFVVEGKARLRINAEEKEVGPGAILYVRATEDHSFFDITEDLSLLAFFGKPELTAG